MAQFVKQLDPNHLVTLDSEGFLGPSTEGDVNRHLQLAAPLRHCQPRPARMGSCQGAGLWGSRPQCSHFRGLCCPKPLLRFLHPPPACYEARQGGPSQQGPRDCSLKLQLSPALPPPQMLIAATHTTAGSRGATFRWRPAAHTSTLPAATSTPTSG